MIKVGQKYKCINISVFPTLRKEQIYKIIRIEMYNSEYNKGWIYNPCLKNEDWYYEKTFENPIYFELVEDVIELGEGEDVNSLSLNNKGRFDKDIEYKVGDVVRIKADGTCKCGGYMSKGTKLKILELNSYNEKNRLFVEFLEDIPSGSCKIGNKWNIMVDEIEHDIIKPAEKKVESVTTSKYKIGDEVKIIARNHGVWDSFKLGDICEYMEEAGYIPPGTQRLKRKSDESTQYVHVDDFELYASEKGMHDNNCSWLGLDYTLPVSSIRPDYEIGEYYEIADTSNVDKSKFVGKHKLIGIEKCKWTADIFSGDVCKKCQGRLIFENYNIKGVCGYDFNGILPKYKRVEKDIQKEKEETVKYIKNLQKMYRDGLISMDTLQKNADKVCGKLKSLQDELQWVKNLQSGDEIERKDMRVRDMVIVEKVGKDYIQCMGEGKDYISFDIKKDRDGISQAFKMNIGKEINGKDLDDYFKMIKDAMNNSSYSLTPLMKKPSHDLLCKRMGLKTDIQNSIVSDILYDKEFKDKQKVKTSTASQILYGKKNMKFGLD